MTQKQKRGKTNAEFAKDAREAELALKNLEAENAKLREMVEPNKGRPVLYAEYGEVSRALKQWEKLNLIQECRSSIRPLLTFADDVQRHKRKETFAVSLVNAKKAIEDWSERVSGYRWDVKWITPIANVGNREKNIPPDPERDFLDIMLTHPGKANRKLVDATITPDVQELQLKTRIYRYEVE